jgi:3D (Asp-Asp-Asp) domain-containing protein
MSTWRRGLDRFKKHPYVDSGLLLAFLIFAVGGVRWWGGSTVLLQVDGAKRKIRAQGKTVGELLQQEQVTLGPEDLCNPPPEDSLAHQTVIQITRVKHLTETRVVRNPPKIYSRIQLKSNLRPALVERGYVEVDSMTVRTTYHDNLKVTEEILKRKTRRLPVFTLTLFSTKTTQPIKTYDLAKAPRLEMRATGYYVGEKYVPSDTTYLGYKLRRGLVAVDPKVIPLRTRLYVKGYGYAYAADTGSAIKGNRIDLAVKDKKEEARFNRQKMTVYILEKSRNW